MRAPHACAALVLHPPSFPLQFKSLLGCMIRHKDYHEPLFDALQMDVERTSQSMERKEGQGQQYEQQQQQQVEAESAAGGNHKKGPL